MKIAHSHIWQLLKRGPMTDKVCFYCDRIIPKGSKKIRKYDSAYASTKYAHDRCLERAKKEEA